MFGQRAAEGEGDQQGLPPLVSGSEKADNVPVKTDEATEEADVTKPPPRISEARLLSLMENAGKQIDDEDLAAILHEKGLGTPATRAETIENLKAKEYVDQNLRPTVKGMRLIDILRRIRAEELTSAELTGEMEYHLNQVEHGHRAADDYIKEVKEYTSHIVDRAKEFDYDAIYPNENPLGLCPCELKRPVYERTWFYRCQEDPAAIEAENDCPFRIWKDKSGRYIDRQTVEILLRDGQTGEVDGFMDRQGRTYKGILSIENKEVVLKPVGGPEGPAAGVKEFEVNPEPLGPCPVHKDGGCQVIETPTAFVCTTFQREKEEGVRRPQGFYLPRTVCRREMTREEAGEYIRTGETPWIEDFISKYNRPFRAKLKLKEDGGRSFEFAPRDGQVGGGRKKKAGGRKKTGGRKATNKKKAAAKNTSAKKAPGAEKQDEVRLRLTEVEPNATFFWTFTMRLARCRSALGWSMAALWLFLAAGLTSAADYPKPVPGDFTLRGFRFASGKTLPELRIHYRTLGEPQRDENGIVTNAVLILHGTTGSGGNFLREEFAGELFGKGQPLDTSRYYLILPDNIGHGRSSKPSGGLKGRFPRYGYHDMIAAQYRLLTEGLKVNHLRLVMGTSMGGMHTWLWGQKHPQFMDALMPLASLPTQISGAIAPGGESSLMPFETIRNGRRVSTRVSRAGLRRRSKCSF